MQIKKDGSLLRTTIKRCLWMVLWLCSAFLVICPETAWAATFIWDGGSGNNNWTTAANWNPNGTPDNDGTADIVMAGVVRPTPTANALWDFSGLTFDNTAAAFTLGGSQLTIRGSGITNNSTNLQTIGNNIVLNVGQTWSAASGDILVIGVVSGGVVTLTKSGAGTLTLTGANTYGGTTTINAGRLTVNNMSGSGTGTSAVTVGASGTLSGSGGAAGAVTLSGTVEPGVNTGTLNTGAETWNPGGHYIWEINQANGTKGTATGWDWLNSTGGFSINATSGSPFTIHITSLDLTNAPGQAANFNNTQSYTWPIATGASGFNNFAANKFVLDASAFQNNLGGGTFSLEQLNNDLNLKFTPATTVSGKVFEDVNYGGGAGRNWTTASGNGGSARPNARVELFDSVGSFITATTTDGAGNYSFSGVSAGNYTIRVVSASVTSSRGGSGLLPVQTYRTNASTGTAVDVTDYVGGHDPATADAGNAAAGWILNSSTGVFSGSGSGKANAFAPVTVSGAIVTGMNFGFNFNTIMNNNDTGQGSLRQFIINSNALGNAGLAMQGQPAGQDVSVFMISDGLAHPGLRAGLANQLSAGVAVITPATALPAVTDANTTIDGTTQTANVGNTNAVVLGTGGTVGVDGLALSAVPGPEVEIAGSGTLADGLLIQANNAIVRGLSILGFGTATSDGGIRVNAFTGALIEGNVLGSRATSFTDPGAAQRNQAGVASTGGSSGIVRNNLIGFGRVTGVDLRSGSTGWVITGNEIRDSGMDTADGDGITVDASPTNTAIGNLITGTSSQAIAVTVAGATGNQFINNTVRGNGVGIASGLVQSSSVVLRNGAASTTLDRNVIRANYGAGVQANNGSTGTRMTRNSFALNGTIAARNGSGPTGQIAIDLNSPTDDINFGTAPFYTLNDANDADTGANGLFNFPVLTSASVIGGNLVITGYARPGSLIELYIANPNPLNFGQGETYLLTLTEGGTGAGGTDPYADTDAGTGAYGPGAINGIVQGTDNTNRFTFTFPIPGGVSSGTGLTATATLGGETSEFSGFVTVAGVTLAIVKQTWELNGTTPLGSPVTAPAGATLVFLIYVKNTTAIPVTDIRINDLLDQTGFDYVSGSLVRTLAATPPADTATDKQLFDATDPGTGTALSDVLDGDASSALDTGAPAGVDRITIGAVTGQANGSLTINAHTAFALRFMVKIK